MLEDDGSDTVRVWRFGEFVLDTMHRRLLRNGEPVHVDERPFDLLDLLASNWDRPLDRREITTALWGARPVSDNTLRQLVYKARRAVDDDGEHQNIIRTLHGRSLQWVAPLEPLAETPLTTGVAAHDGQARTLYRARWVWAALLMVLAMSAFVLLVPQAKAPGREPLPRVAVTPMSNATGDASLDWIKDALPGLLSTLLADSGSMDVVNPVQVAKAWNFRLQQDRNREQQLRFVTGATVLIGGSLYKLTAQLYELKLRVQTADGADTEVLLEGGQPGALVADAVGQIRRLLRLDPRTSVPKMLAQRPFVAEAYARGMGLLAQGKPIDARPYFELCATQAPDFLPAQLNLGVTQYHSHDPQAAKRTLQHLLIQARQRHDIAMRGRALLELGVQSRHEGNEADAQKFLGEALVFLRQVGNIEDQINAYAYLVVSGAVSGQFAFAQQQLAKAQWLASQHPNIRSAQSSVTSVEGILAMQQGDHAAALVAFKKGLAQSEADGDVASVVRYNANIGGALVNAHTPLQAIGVLVLARSKAMQTNNWGVMHIAGVNLFWALGFVGLWDHALDLAASNLAMSKHRGNKYWQWVDWNLHALAELERADYRAAMKSLRSADALTTPQNIPAKLLINHSLFEGIAAFEVEPQRLEAVRREFDESSKAFASTPGVAHCAHLLRALAASAAKQPEQALAWLKLAATDPRGSSDRDIQRRMAPLLIALAEHSTAAAEVALDGYDPAHAEDASVLPLTIQWATQRGDAQSAARASDRLAALRTQGLKALAAAGLDRKHPFAMSAVHVAYAK